MTELSFAEQLAALREQAADNLSAQEFCIAEMRRELAEALKTRDELRALVRELAPRKRRQRKEND